jgi:hypothetical protein
MNSSPGSFPRPSHRGGADLDPLSGPEAGGLRGVRLPRRAMRWWACSWPGSNGTSGSPSTGAGRWRVPPALERALEAEFSPSGPARACARVGRAEFGPARGSAAYRSHLINAPARGVVACSASLPGIPRAMGCCCGRG